MNKKLKPVLGVYCQYGNPMLEGLSRHKCYPGLRFYLGYYIKVCKILKLKGIEIITQYSSSKLTTPLEGSDCDYILKSGLTLSIRDNESADYGYPILFAGFMGGSSYYEDRMRFIADIAEMSLQFSYLDSDNENTGNQSRNTLFYKFLSQVNNPVADKLRDNLTSIICTSYNSVLKYLKDGINAVYVPYVYEPSVYLSEEFNETTKPFSDRHKVASFRTFLPKQLNMDEYDYQSILDKNSYQYYTMKDLRDQYQNYVFLLGSNYPFDHDIKVTSKIIECTNAGCIPMMIKIADKSSEEYKYVSSKFPYFKWLPEEIFAQQNSKHALVSDWKRCLDYVANLSESEYYNIINRLKSEVIELHHPDTWIDNIKESIKEVLNNYENIEYSVEI